MPDWKHPLRKLILALPYSSLLYNACDLYMRHFDGENNSDPNLNGEMRFLRLNLPPCRTIFDVGANVGNWAVCALQNAPQATLHCFEPDSMAFAKLSRNLPDQRVQLNNVAVGDREGEARLFVSGDASTHNSLYVREGLATNVSPKAITVPVVTVDAYCRAKAIGEIDFLKIDTEGNEVNVLMGAQHMLREARVRFIQFEYGGTF
jgi:FkbM family methyltransferase